MLGVVAAAVIVIGVGYFLFLFLAGSAGIAAQLADPTALRDFNGTVVLWLSVPLTLVAYVVAPEFGRDLGRRIPVVLGSTFVGLVCTLLATSFLGPSLARPSVHEHLAAANLLFSTFCLLPTLVTARLLTFFHADVVTARQGDTCINTDQLEGETKRLVEKYCGPAMRRPAGWRPFTLWGDAGRLSYADLQKIFALEEAEERRLAELYRQRTGRAAADVHVETAKAFAAYKAYADGEIAQLRDALAHVTAEAARRAAADQEATAALTKLHAAERLRADCLHAEAIDDLTRARAKNDGLMRELAAAHATAAARATSLTKAIRAAQRAEAEEAALREELVAVKTMAAARVCSLTTALADAEAAHAGTLHDLTCLSRAHALSQVRIERLNQEKDELRALHERQLDRLNPERLGRSAPAAVAGATRTAPHRPANRRGEESNPQQHLSLVIDNAPYLPKSPKRQGMPHRAWRRIHESRRRKEHAR
jgi:hypothetical protein